MNGKKLKWFMIVGMLLLSMVVLPLVSAQDDDTSYIELIGAIEAVSDTTITVNQITVDISDAEINAVLEVDAIVKVEGSLADDGSVVAREVNAVEEGLLPGEVEIIGLLESMTADSITVNGLLIDISSAEVDQTVLAGDTVKVYAMINEDGNWIAREVEAVDFIDDSNGGDDDGNGNDNDNANSNDDNANGNDNDSDMLGEDFKLIGTLQEVGDGIIVVSGVSIDITYAEIEDRLIIGALVRVEVRVVDGALIASEVKLAERDDVDDDFVIPGDCSQPRGWITYAVQSGDTLSSIAARTGTTVDILTAVNCIDNPSLISVGTQLFVPRELDDRTFNTNDNGNFNDNDDGDDNFNDNDDNHNDNDDDDNDNDDNDNDDDDDDDNSGSGSNDNDDDD